ncbi:GntR family transcriptional regulator [Arthrobacter agilis]|uniref:GntR family transcriptional regulator n=1 Tax=Arthrobacter agilis TaxID=37921 RepID=UPI002781DA43|nr:GntR family transcriptional regulator [Arthrobacter agilis]MDQ0736852.1 DNA-binding GntR family transcriptional regulator [Arthrobacter agilis]
MTNAALSARADSDAIFVILRDEILTGVHQPGTPMREVALAERFGVSRTPIREALSRLQQEHLLRRVDRGLQVPEIDPQQVIHVYDMRILLEQEAAAQAATARQFTNLMRLEALVERDRCLVEPTDQTRRTTNLEFHAAVWASTHNPVLQDLLKRLSTHLIHAPKSTLSVGDRWAESLDEHEQLVQAIERRDEAGAREIAGRHMRTAREIRLQLLRKSALEQLAASP